MSGSSDSRAAAILRERRRASSGRRRDISSLTASGRRRGGDPQQRRSRPVVDQCTPDRRRPRRRPSPPGRRAASRSCGDRPIFSVRVKTGCPCSPGRSRGPGVSRTLGLADGVREDRPGRRGDRVPCTAPSVAAAGRRAGRRGRAVARSSKRPVSGSAQPGPTGLATCTLPTSRGWTWCWPLKLMPFQSMKPCAGPGRREPQRVVVEDHPAPARATRRRARRRAGRRSPCRRCSARRRRPRRSPSGSGRSPSSTHGSMLDRLRARGSSPSAAGQVGVVDPGVLAGIVRLQVRLADVVDHVVLLPRHHPRLRRPSWPKPWVSVWYML